MKRNRESQYRIKLIQEMYLNKEDQRVLEEAIHDAKITFSKIYRIGIHRTVDVNKLVEFIKRYGEHCKGFAENTQFWVRSPYTLSTPFYLGKHWINRTEQYYGVMAGFCI